jgi:PAS domain S-box-containing protein
MNLQMAKRAKNTCRNSEQKALSREQRLLHLAAIVESSDDAILSKNLDAIITSWNKGAERLYGYTAAEVLGKPASILAPPDRPDEIRGIMEMLRRGERVDHFRTERVARDGRRFHVSLTVSPVYDGSGTIIGASAIARDISLQNAAEAALRRSEKLAVTGRLAATIAHEINNPLEAVTNLIYLAMSELPTDSPARRYLETADSELGRVVQIARQTLGFQRDTAVAGPIVLSNLLDEVLTLYERKLESRKIQVQRRYDVPGEISGISGEIRQVMVNLLSNAFDAMPSGGTLCLHIYCGHDGRHRPGVRVSVADDGMGIAPAVRERLFEPFFTTKEDVGTGLGLWIARGILQKHQGSIRLRSRSCPPHTGTVFSLFFPSAPVNSESTAA